MGPLPHRSEREKTSFASATILQSGQWLELAEVVTCGFILRGLADFLPLTKRKEQDTSRLYL